MIAAPDDLYVERWGSGPNLVMLHGWGMHGGLLKDFADRLSRDFCITLVDLPGHGRSPIGSWRVEDLVKALLHAAPPRSHWLGWSLGGVIATLVARAAPEPPLSLTLMASSPCFIQVSDWPGVLPRHLEEMAAQLVEDAEGTMNRFVGLQTFGQVNARDLARQIKHAVASRPLADPRALEGGLTLLLEQDLRSDLAMLSLPIAVVLGELDRLVPIAVADRIRSLRSDIDLLIVPGAAHFPFWTHRDEVAEFLRNFLLRVPA